MLRLLHDLDCRKNVGNRAYLTVEASDVGIISRLDLFLVGLGAVAAGVTGLLAVMAHYGGHSASPSIS